MPHMSTAEIFRIPKHAAFTWQSNYENSRYRLIEATMMKTEKLLYSRKETAKLLGVCTLTLDRLVSRGELPARPIGRRVMFSPDALQQFVAGGRANGRKKN
ncbi:MAG TPA: helix-turn-helix domain-containing protein [Candidatus Acidoferrum sp.]|nr:helix-turn-helix domain-containing protein [Candidatus Acidoferrum sp.]